MKSKFTACTLCPKRDCELLYKCQYCPRVILVGVCTGCEGELTLRCSIDGRKSKCEAPEGVIALLRVVIGEKVKKKIEAVYDVI